MEEKPERQRGLNGEVGVRPLPTTRANPRRLPTGDGLRGAPHGDVASVDEGAIVGGPVRDAVLRLVRRMDSRLHPLSVGPFPERIERIPGL